MRIHVHDIIPGLQPYIKMVCSLECDDGIDTQLTRVLPDTCVELFINYTDAPVAIIENKLHQRSIVSFRMSEPMDVQMRKGAGCLAICFHPGMAYLFFKVPMHVHTDTTVTLSDLWNGMSAEIEDQLANAPDNTSRAVIAQKYLLQQLSLHRQDVQMTNCLRHVQHNGHLFSVSDLTRVSGISQRHLSRKFQQCVGSSPKEYLRVCRFLRSLHHLKKHPRLSLTEVGYESGYYDQAHFNRDYKAYTGHTPGEVVRSSHILW